MLLNANNRRTKRQDCCTRQVHRVRRKIMDVCDDFTYCVDNIILHMYHRCEVTEFLSKGIKKKKKCSFTGST